MIKVLHTLDGRGGTKLYSGLKYCKYCIPRFAGLVRTYTVEQNAVYRIVGVVPICTSEYTAARTAYLGW